MRERAISDIAAGQQEPQPSGPDVNVEEGVGPNATLQVKVASGIRWGFIASFLTQIGRFFFVVALMRLLGPHNYGIVGQATLFIAIAQIFVHFGLAASIVQAPRLDQSEVGTAFLLNVALGLLIAALLALSAPLISSIFETEELTAVLRLLSISIVLRSLTVVPSALLTRNMQFRDIATAEVISTFVSGALGVGAAVMGAGYWALVIQAVCLETIYLFLIQNIIGLPKLAWSGTAARRLWSFSSRLMGADLVNYASGNSDKFLVAYFLGPIQLGLYSLAFRVLQLVLQVFAQTGRVVLPTFARLQDDRERLTRVFLRVTESVSLAIFPAMALIMLCAPLGVTAVFGDAWADAVVPFQLLAAMTIPCVLVSFMGPLTVAVGRADWEFYWSISTTIASLIAFSIGLQWGIVGMAVSYLIVVSLQIPVRFVITQRLIPISVRSYIRALAPAMASSAALTIVWILAEALLQGVMGGLALLTVASFAGTAAYIIALRLAWPDDFRRQLDFAHLVLGGDRAEATP